jgi:hypothetical protein
MKRSHAWLVFLAGLTLMLGSLAGLFVPAIAQEAPPAGDAGGVGGYSLSATAAASRQIFRPENNIVPAENLLDLSIPFSVAQLTQGSGRALGSTVWPGDTLATACRAEPSVPCYPFYAESFYPQGPADGKAAQEIPGTTMSAHSEEQESVGKGEVTPVGASGELIGAATSSSTASIKTGLAVAESVSRVSDIILGAGAIRIESVVSTAKATSDGNAADAVGSTKVEGFTIAGFPVAVTTEGVSIAGQADVPNPLGQVIDPVNAALEALGAKITLSNPIVTKQGGAADVIAGGLIISLDNSLLVGDLPPEVKAQLPLDPQGKLTLVFGSASASADASPGFGEDLPIEDVAPVAEITDTGTGDLSAGDSVAVATDVSNPPAAAPTDDGATVQGTRASAVSTTAVGLGLVLLALAGAILGAIGLQKLGTGMFEPISVTACPQEKS